MPFSANKNTWFSLAVLGAAVLLLVYLPLLAQVRKKGNELNGLTDRLRASEAELAGVSGDAGGKRIIPESGASALVDRITREGKNCLLDFKSIAQKEIRPFEDGYRVLPLQLEIEAGFEQLGVFLEKLDNMEEGIVSVDSFQILRDERLLPKVSALLNLNLYLQKDLSAQ